MVSCSLFVCIVIPLGNRLANADTVGDGATESDRQPGYFRVRQLGGFGADACLFATDDRAENAANDLPA